MRSTYAAFGHVLVQIVASLDTRLFPRIVSYGVSISLFTLWLLEGAAGERNCSVLRI